MIEGKTKIVRPLWEGSHIAVVQTKDDITAGDGAKHDILTGKAELATRTTCNVFELLRLEDVPIAYIGRDGPTTFLAHYCSMIPVEVVVRSRAAGSYLKRHPECKKGFVFGPPIVEFFYKTSNRRVSRQVLPCDDPLMSWNEKAGYWELFEPGTPSKSIGKLLIDGHNDLKRDLADCEKIARIVEKYLRNAWEDTGGVLYDFKLEFGILPNGEIVLADVIDCDSWRVEWNGLQLSKQGYRDGDDLERVLGVYRIAATLTDQFI